MLEPERKPLTFEEFLTDVLGLNYDTKNAVLKAAVITQNCWSHRIVRREGELSCANHE
jgi:hypothetical protein